MPYCCEEKFHPVESCYVVQSNLLGQVMTWNEQYGHLFIWALSVGNPNEPYGGILYVMVVIIAHF